MSTRLVAPWKRSNSNFYWFRMVVPPRFRDAVGRSEIKQSLATAHIGEAKRLCARLQAEWLGRFEAIRKRQEKTAAEEGVQIVDRFLDNRAERCGGLDAVMDFELQDLALAEATLLLADEEELSDRETCCTALHDRSTTSDDLSRLRQSIEIRRNALRPNARTALLPGREAARRAQSVCHRAIATGFLEEAFNYAGIAFDVACPRFAVAADRYFERLLENRRSELKVVEEVFPVPPQLAPSAFRATPATPAIPTNPDGLAMLATADAVELSKADTARSALRATIQGEAATARTISQVFEAWAAKQPLETAKLQDEWRVSIRRFVELFGDLDVRAIDSDMILDFREAMRALPSRPKGSVGTLPLLRQIEVARDQGLRKLSGPTVGKLLSGLRVTLAHAVDPLRLIKVNPASGVSVDDASSEVDARVPFSPEDLRAIFEMPRMVDPRDSSPESEFWLLLLAPLTGLRIEEMAKLRPENVKCERDTWYICVERDKRRKRREQALNGEAAKSLKTSNANRDIPLHPILLAAGFVDYAQRAQIADHDWLFPDLEADKYGNRSKNVSRRIIRSIRKLGIDDEEKVFHSFRHSMKRACRNTMMKEEIADLLAGHAPASVGRKYGAGAALGTLDRAVRMIEYELVDWTPVIAAARKRQSFG